MPRHAADIQTDKDDIQRRSGKEVPEVSVLRPTKKTDHSVAPSSMQGRSIIRTP